MTDGILFQAESVAANLIGSINEGVAFKYAFARIALTPKGIMPLIEEVLADGEPMDRAEISKRIEALHLDRGGKTTELLLKKVQKALRFLKERGKIIPVGSKHYVATGSMDDGSYPTKDPEDDDPELDEDDIDVDAAVTEQTNATVVASLAPVSEAGYGLQKVYVYYYKNDRALALLEGRDCWPCKVGHTTTSVADRILGQGVTAMHTLPIVGLVIHTPEAYLIEKALHGALRLAGRAVAGTPKAGAEWFDTTPEAIRAWYEAFSTSLGLLGGNAQPIQNGGASESHLRTGVRS